MLWCLDIQTRWNSTYLMLDTPIKYERAFGRFQLDDPYKPNELDCLPTSSDWAKARFLRVSGSKHVTSNHFFQEIGNMNSILVEMMGSRNEISRMAKSVKE